MLGKGMYTVCRLCLGEEVELLNVFLSEGIAEWTVADAITELLEIQVSEGDVYPQCVCIDCIRKLKEFKLFKQQCERNKELLDRAYAGKFDVGANEYILGSILCGNGNQSEVNIKEEEEGVEIPIEKDPLDLDEVESPIKSEIDDTFNSSSVICCSEVVDSADQVSSYPLKSEYEDPVGTLEADYIIKPTPISALAVESNVEIPDVNAPCKNTFDESDDYIKEEVVDILAESDSDNSFDEGIPHISLDELAASSVENSFYISKVEGSINHSNINIFGSNSSGPQLENEGSVNISTLSEMEDINLNAENINESEYVSLGTEGNSYSCDVCEEKFTRIDDIEAHMNRHGKIKPFMCELCNRGFYMKESRLQHKCNVKVIPSIRTKQPFVCEWCGKEFAFLSRLQRHVLSHTGGKPFHCDQCKESFSEKGYLDMHLLEHLGRSAYICPLCDKRFSSQCNLKKHMILHSTARPFRCHECDKTFSQKVHLQKHIISHSLKSPFGCPECGKVFSKKEYLRKHKVTHSMDRPYKCDNCAKSFPLKSALVKHMIIHSRVRQFKCELCDKEFYQNSNLKAHMITHSGDKPFKCMQCNKAFSQKSNLSSHMKTHSRKKKCSCPKCDDGEFCPNGQMNADCVEKPFTCDECQKKFAKKRFLRAHMKMHSPRIKLKCPKCVKEFSQKKHLQQHALIHSGERPHKCTDCDWTFTQKIHLKSHMMVHSGEKPFKCDRCDKLFTKKSNLKNHCKRTHSENSTLECDLCGKEFYRMGHLKRHIMKHSHFKVC